MKKLLYILLLLPFLSNAQTFQTNGKNVRFNVAGGTGTGSPGGTVQVDRKVLTDSLISKDSLIVVNDKSTNFLYMGQSYPYIPGDFYAPFHGLSGDTNSLRRMIAGQVNFGGSERYWAGFFNPADIDYGPSLLEINEKVVSLRAGDTLYKRRHGLSIRLPGSTQGLPGLGLSYYDTARYEAGYTAYPSYSGGGLPHADHFIFDEVANSDIAIHQVMPFNTFSATMYDTVARAWNEIQITDSVKIFTGITSNNWFYPPDSNMAISVDVLKNTTFYGPAGADYDFSSVNPSDKNLFAQRSYVDGRLVTPDYGITVTGTSSQRNVSIAFTGSGTGASTVNLSALPVGALVRVSDLDNKAAANNITIDAGGGNSINNSGTVAQILVIDADGLSYSIQKMTSTKWMVVSINQ